MEQRIYLFLLSIIPTEFTISLKTGPDENLEELIAEKRRQIIVKHNEYRTLHNAENLTASKFLDFYAQQWVHYELSIGILISRPKRRFGENLWSHNVSHVKDLMTSDATNPVLFWYNQIHNYPGMYDNGTEKHWKYFTQLVWQESRSIGIGIKAHHCNDIIFVACYYNPPGNANPNDPIAVTLGRFVHNVLPPVGSDWPRPVPISCYLVIFIICFISLGSWILCNYE